MKLNKKTKKYLKNRLTGYLDKDQKSSELNKYLRLDLGENLLVNLDILKIKEEINEDTLKYYADPSNSGLKSVIADLLNIISSNITIANSSDQLIDLLPRMILEKGENSLVINPTFFRYEDSVLKAGGKSLSINLSELNRYRPNEKLIRDICEISIKNKVRIIWICNPNNPTGEIYDLKDLEKIVKNSKALVIVDEAYYEVYDPQNKNSAIQLINKYSNLIVLRTLSKGYGLAGLRLGYAIAHPQIISTIENYQDTLLMTSALTTKLAQNILKNPNYIQDSIKKTHSLKIKIYNELSKLKNLQIGADTKTNVYLLRHKIKDLYPELLKRGIRTADLRSAKGLENLGYVRITIGNEYQNQKLITALKEVN